MQVFLAKILQWVLTNLIWSAYKWLQERVSEYQADMQHKKDLKKAQKVYQEAQTPEDQERAFQEIIRLSNRNK